VESVSTLAWNTQAEGDGARLRTVRELEFSKGDNAEVLLFDLRAHELHHH
jgi:hypothetical protein